MIVISAMSKDRVIGSGNGIPLVFEDVRLRGDDSVELRASVDKDSD